MVLSNQWVLHTSSTTAVDLGFYYGIFADDWETPSAALVKRCITLVIKPTLLTPNNLVILFNSLEIHLMGDQAFKHVDWNPPHISCIMK
jgi:hypothetical protein